MFPQYLQYLLMDFCLTFVIGAFCDKDETDYVLGSNGVKVTLSSSRHPALDAQLYSFTR